MPSLYKRRMEMRKAYAGIGSMFGDEGKGHITDILCNRNTSRTINVRINGGAQASHTVVTPDGKRHAFRHFGAGTFTGSPTYLSKEFIVNGFAFDLERTEISKKFGITPSVCVNPECRVTTLWDMYINQMVERLRGDRKHGSCGFGINETVHRSKYDEYRITAMDLLSEAKLLRKLKAIKYEYLPMRLQNKYNVSLSDLPSEFSEDFHKENIIPITMQMAEIFKKNTMIMGDNILDRFDVAVFEGAQGLQLDQGNRKYWPNVTTSNTGIKNMMEILNGIGYNGDLEIFYISRCYATRHGEGTFPTETPFKPYPNIVDLTNVPNEFQGALRFGILDLDLLIEGITKDLQNLNRSAKVNFAFTCFDQVGENVWYKYKDKEHSVSRDDFLKVMRNILMQDISILSDMYVTTQDSRDKLFRV